MILLFILTVGCEKEDANKNPTIVSFSLTMTPDGIGPTDDLILDDGYIVLGNFTVSGERNNAENFEFAREFPGGLKIPFMSSAVFSELQFDLPQGDYNRITVRFETLTGNDINLFVSGEYNYNNPLKPSSLVHLELNSPKIFETELTDISGMTEISLNEFKQETPDIILNPQFWFSDVTVLMLNNTNFDLVNGEQIITIDNNNNSNIFSVVDSMAGGDIKCIL
jgi:hypothetical protein